jgi:hypothetical protein
MKRLFIALAIAAASSFSTVSANPHVTSPVLEAFRSTYLHAKDVHWTELRNTYKVSFLLDGQYVSAFYKADGHLVGTVRNISVTELSLRLKTNLRKEMNNAWITDLFVLNTNDEDVYFATVESADQKTIFKSRNGRKWEIYESLRK